MKATIMIVAVAAVLFCASGYTVQPAYEGAFGNPEEPALRIVKWPWLGVKKLVSDTHEGLKAGMDKKCLCATGEKGVSGAWKGSKTLVHHTANGLIYAPLPKKEDESTTQSYETHAMAFIETVTAAENKEQAEAAAETTEATADTEAKQEEKYLDTKIPESEVEKAQRRYIPQKAAYRDREYDGGGNLLKLVR